MEIIERLLADFSGFLWNWPVAVLLVGGGLWFTVITRGVPLRYFFHALQVVRGRYDRPDDPGQITHFRALASALAATVGMGNVSGVAIAITTGGPGAVFWMWVSAFVGMATKFFTCTLAILYRGRDENGEVQGGPMYYLVEGLGPRARPLAVFFCVAGLIGCLAIVQSNQLAQVLREEVFLPNDWLGGSPTAANAVVGVVSMVATSAVIFGGIRRIAAVAARLVPAMVVLYLGTTVWILVSRFDRVPDLVGRIVSDAFTGEAVLGGAVGTLILTGVRRAAFSNEAGIGTEAMAHGAARTREPVREGLVAMLGPLVDTLVVCTATALVILMTDGALDADRGGVTLTSMAFEEALPGVGRAILVVCVTCFAFSTMLGYSYYGTKCAAFLFGVRARLPYEIFYVAMLGAGSLVTLDVVFSLIDSAYALMSIPTMIGALWLSPRVLRESRDYFSRLRSGEMEPGAGGGSGGEGV